MFSFLQFNIAMRLSVFEILKNLQGNNRIYSCFTRKLLFYRVIFVFHCTHKTWSWIPFFKNFETKRNLYFNLCLLWQLLQIEPFWCYLTKYDSTEHDVTCVCQQDPYRIFPASYLWRTCILAVIGNLWIAKVSQVWRARDLVMNWSL